MKGNLIIISSPSGGGKGTLIREIMKMDLNLGYSVSYTTRAPRPGEIDGKDYFFVSTDEFKQRIADGDFLEYAVVHANMYGTSIKQIGAMTELGLDVILEIDVQGADSVLAKVPHAVSIFILPPSYEVLKARLTARATEDANDLDLRLQNSYGEVMRYTHFKFVVINDKLEAAANKLASVIKAEKQRRDRQTVAIQDILDSFERSKF